MIRRYFSIYLLLSMFVSSLAMKHDPLDGLQSMFDNMSKDDRDACGDLYYGFSEEDYESFSKQREKEERIEQEEREETARRNRNLEKTKSQMKMHDPLKGIKHFVENMSHEDLEIYSGSERLVNDEDYGPNIPKHVQDEKGKLAWDKLRKGQTTVGAIISEYKGMKEFRRSEKLRKEYECAESNREVQRSKMTPEEFDRKKREMGYSPKKDQMCSETSGIIQMTLKPVGLIISSLIIAGGGPAVVVAAAAGTALAVGLGKNIYDTITNANMNPGKEGMRDAMDKRKNMREGKLCVDGRGREYISNFDDEAKINGLKSTVNGLKTYPHMQAHANELSRLLTLKEKEEARLQSWGNRNFEGKEKLIESIAKTTGIIDVYAPGLERKLQELNGANTALNQPVRNAASRTMGRSPEIGDDSWGYVSDLPKIPANTGCNQPPKPQPKNDGCGEAPKPIPTTLPGAIKAPKPLDNTLILPVLDIPNVLDFKKTQDESIKIIKETLPDVTPLGKPNSELIQYKSPTDFEDSLKVIDKLDPIRVEDKLTKDGKAFKLITVDDGVIIFRPFSSGKTNVPGTEFPTIEVQVPKGMQATKFRMTGKPETEL
jgi:hypothetical protein